MFKERDDITLHGLRSRPDLNGQSGTLVQWHEERQRWAVEVDESEESIWVKPENLSRQVCDREYRLEPASTSHRILTKTGSSYLADQYRQHGCHLGFHLDELCLDRTRRRRWRRRSRLSSAPELGRGSRSQWSWSRKRASLRRSSCPRARGRACRETRPRSSR